MAKAAAPSTRVVFAILFAVSLASSTAFTAMQSVLPAIGRSTGVADNLIVTISSMSAFLAIFALPFWGRMSDRFGAKPVVLIGLFGIVVSTIATGAAVMIGLRHLDGPGMILFSLIATRAIYGLVGLAFQPAVIGYVGVTTSREERTNAMALLASANGIGAIIGPAVAPFMILPVVSFAGVFFAFGLICAVLFGVVAIGVPRDGPGVRAAARGPSARAMAVLTDPRLRPFAIYGALLSIVATASGQTLGFLVMDRMDLPPIQAQPFAGMAMMSGAVAVLAAQWGLIRLLKLTPRVLLLSGAALAAVGMAAQAFAPGFVAIAATFALASLGIGLARPGFTAGISLAAPLELQSMVAGALGGIGAFGLVLGPVGAMTLYLWSRPLPFLVSGAIMAGLAAYSMVSPALRQAAPEPRVSAPDDVEAQQAG